MAQGFTTMPEHVKLRVLSCPPIVTGAPTDSPPEEFANSSRTVCMSLTAFCSSTVQHRTPNKKQDTNKRQPEMYRKIRHQGPVQLNLGSSSPSPNKKLSLGQYVRFLLGGLSCTTSPNVHQICLGCPWLTEGAAWSATTRL